MMKIAVKLETENNERYSMETKVYGRRLTEACKGRAWSI